MHCFQNTDMDNAVVHSPAKFESHLKTVTQKLLHMWFRDSKSI